MYCGQDLETHQRLLNEKQDHKWCGVFTANKFQAATIKD